MLRQVLTGQLPLSNTTTDLSHDPSEAHLALPSEIPNRANSIWDLVERCWKVDQNSLPKLKDIRGKLEECGSNWTLEWEPLMPLLSQSPIQMTGGLPPDTDSD